MGNNVLKYQMSMIVGASSSFTAVVIIRFVPEETIALIRWAGSDGLLEGLAVFMLVILGMVYREYVLQDREIMKRNSRGVRAAVRREMGDGYCIESGRDGDTVWSGLHKTR